MKSIFFVTLGSFSLILGVIGAFLPLLPTTPFLLLAAFCFDRGSPEFHRWLIHHPYLGPPIRDWQQRRIIRRRYKALAITMIIVSGAYLFQKQTINVSVKVFLFLIFALVITFISRQKSERR